MYVCVGNTYSQPSISAGFVSMGFISKDSTNHGPTSMDSTWNFTPWLVETMDMEGWLYLL